MHLPFRLFPRVRLRQAGILSLLLTTVSLPSSFAIDRVGPGLQHFFSCFGVMLSDPNQHSQNCLPNRVPNPTGSISTSSGTNVVPVIPAPAPVVPAVVVVPVVAAPPAPTPDPVVTPPPPPPPAPDPCACGACYVF